MAPTGACRATRHTMSLYNKNRFEKAGFSLGRKKYFEVFCQRPVGSGGGWGNRYDK
jgi:hypothetical protein